MYDLWLLIKNHLDQEFGISGIRHGTDKRKKRTFAIRILSMLLILAVMVTAFYQLGNAIVGAGLASATPILGYVIGSILTLMFTILKINEVLSGKADAEFLMAMPVPTFFQVLCVFLRLYCWNTVFVAATNISLMIPYYKAGLAGQGFLGHWIAGVFLTCLPVTGIAALLGTFLALILSQAKNSNLIHSGITLGIFLGLGILVLHMAGKVGSILSTSRSADELIATIALNYKLGRMYQIGVVEQNGGYMFLFVMISTIWYLFFFGFFTIAYQEVILALRAPMDYREYHFGRQAQNDIRHALLAREWQQWLRSKSYLISTLVGPMYAVLISLFCLIRGRENLVYILGYHYSANQLAYVSTFLLCALVGAGCSTYCAFSMESSRCWIMQTAPMNRRDLASCKIEKNLWITIPTAFISGLLMDIALRPRLGWSILSLAVLVGYAVISAYWGNFVEKRYADYSYDSENQILRQNASFFLGWVPGVVLPLAVMILFLLR